MKGKIQNTLIKVIFGVVLALIGLVLTSQTISKQFPIGKMIIAAMGGAVQGFSGK